MTNLVFELGTNGTALVYRGSTQSGVTTNKTLQPALSVTSVPSLTISRVYGKVLTVNQPASVQLTKQISTTKTVVTTTLPEGFTGFDVPGALAQINEVTVPSLSRQVNKVLSVATSSAPTLARQFNSGSAHSTFFQNPLVNQPTVPAVTKGIQTVKSVATRSVPSLTITAFGHSTQFQTLSVATSSVPQLDKLVISAPVPTIRKIVRSLVTPSGIQLGGHTGLKWASWDAPTPDLIVGPPTDKGSAGVMDSSGVFRTDLPNSALAVGGVCWLVVTDSDGTPEKNPPTNVFSGPVVVS